MLWVIWKIYVMPLSAYFWYLSFHAWRPACHVAALYTKKGAHRCISTSSWRKNGWNDFSGDRPVTYTRTFFKISVLPSPYTYVSYNVYLDYNFQYQRPGMQDLENRLRVLLYSDFHIPHKVGCPKTFISFAFLAYMNVNTYVHACM